MQIARNTYKDIPKVASWFIGRSRLVRQTNPPELPPPRAIAVGTTAEE